jgi:hypothetical protein
MIDLSCRLPHADDYPDLTPWSRALSAKLPRSAGMLGSGRPLVQQMGFGLRGTGLESL